MTFDPTTATVSEMLKLVDKAFGIDRAIHIVPLPRARTIRDLHL